MKTTEAQRRASKKYHDAHREHYSELSNEYMKKARRERKEYKERCNKAISDIGILLDILKEQPLVHPNCEYEDTTWLENRLEVIKHELEKGENK